MTFSLRKLELGDLDAIERIERVVPDAVVCRCSRASSPSRAHSRSPP